jgi:hypothetical protein
MNKAALYLSIGLLITLCLSFTVQADEELYPIIVKKNLFSPNRTEWRMEERQQKPPAAQKNIPPIDTKQVSLMGTIVIGDKCRALISTNLKNPRAIRKQGRKNTELYMVGDYIQGYRIDEIKQKHVVLVSNEQDDDLTLYLHDGKVHRPGQKTPVPPVPPARGSKPVVRKQGVPPDQLMARMKKYSAVLKQKNNPNVRKQFERDYNKLKRQFASMSQQQRQEAILLKKEVDKMKKQARK